MTEIGKEYGTALFMLACENDQQRNYADALKRIVDIFSENPEYVSLLGSPGIPLGERLGVIETAFAASVPEHVLSYLKLLCEKGRISCFVESVEEYMALLDASERISHAKITSAVPLTEEEKAKLVRKLEDTYKRKMYAEYFVEPSLLGGVIVEADGRIMDGSLRYRLHDVKEVMNS